MLDWLWALFRPTTKITITPLKKTVRRIGGNVVVQCHFQITTNREGREFGYLYRASRAETPFPTPTEFKKIVNSNTYGSTIDGGKPVDTDQLYAELLAYFQVAVSTWHVSWAVENEMDSSLPEQDRLLKPGTHTVRGTVVIPAAVLTGDIYGLFKSPMVDRDYFNFTCVFSPAGTRDTQDIRAEGLFTIYVAELRQAKEDGYA